MKRKDAAVCDQLVEGFDQVRRQIAPTNGESIAVLTSLLGDAIADAPPDVRIDLLRASVSMLTWRARKPGSRNEAVAMNELFALCEVKAI